MTKSQKLTVRASEIRDRLNELQDLDTLTDEQRSELDSLTTEYRTVEAKRRAAIVTEADEAAAQEARFQATDGEGAELRSLGRRVRIGNYVHSAIEGRGVEGAEAEFNAALEIRRPHGFPLRLLASEIRNTTDADGQAGQSSWLDRLFATAAAMAVGISFESVSPGAETYPVMGKDATTPIAGAQRGRGEAAADANHAVTVTRLEPTRNAARTLFNSEDDFRLPGLESAIRRDLGMAVMDAIDKACFLDDDGANENTADITGLATATGVSAPTAITQANKVLFPGTVDAFNELVDGIHASSLDDLQVVAAVGAHRLWCRTLPVTNEATSLKAMLNAAGVTWMARGDIETDTADGDWAAFVGRSRGLAGAGVAAIWSEGQLIRDPYSSAASGQVALTLSYFWNLGFPRASNFGRIAFAA